MSEESLLTTSQPEEGEATEGETVEQPTEQQEAPAQKTEEGPAVERPEWLLDKYATEDRTIEEAMMEQAKAYNEAQKKLGSFTGAPEEDYEFSIPEEYGDLEIDPEMPQYQEFTKWAKDHNLSQDGAQDLFNIFVSYQQDMLGQAETDFTEQKKLLGPQAEQRIAEVASWAGNHLSENEMEVLSTMTYRADQVEVLEKLRSLTRNTKVPGSNDDTTPKQTGYSWDDFDAAVRSDQWSTDERFRKNHRQKAQGLPPRG